VILFALIFPFAIAKGFTQMFFFSTLHHKCVQAFFSGDSFLFLLHWVLTPGKLKNSWVEIEPDLVSQSNNKRNNEDFRMESWEREKIGWFQFYY
jgi:hypothetical protein